jgi:hypothetical protein
MPGVGSQFIRILPHSAVPGWMIDTGPGTPLLQATKVIIEADTGAWVSNQDPKNALNRWLEGYGSLTIQNGVAYINA